MKDRRLIKVQQLLDRVYALPEEILSGGDYPSGSDEQIKSAKEKYFSKRQGVLKGLDAILLETRGFIKVNFGEQSEYFDSLHKIHFNSEKESGFSMNTFNIHHNEYWEKGRNRLISLLLNIKSEVEASIDLEQSQNLPLRNLVLRVVLAFCLYAVCIFLLVQYGDTLSFVFADDKLRAAKTIIGISLLPACVTVVYPKQWQFLIAAFIGLLCVAFGFFR